MKQFLRLIETVRKYDIVGTLDAVKPARLKPPLHFWRDIEECQPIVFQRKHAGPAELEDDPGDDHAPQRGTVQLDDLDAPFRIFSVEMLEGPITSPRHTDKVQLFIWCIVCQETSPKKYLFYALCEQGGTVYVFASNAEGPIVKELLKRLNTEQVGAESVRQRVELGTGKEKRVHRIRRIVHVRPRSEVRQLIANGVPQKIDWTHRWTVRGHWRALPGGLGKDREGNYCVPGFTWVSDFVKGPESAPLIVKTRLVESK